MRVLLAAALLLPLAGCVDAPSGPSGPGAAGDARTLPWDLSQCRYVVGWSEADPAVLQRNLPGGFTVEAGTPLGLPLAPAERAIVGTEAFECASGSGLAGTVEPMLYGSIWIPVTPPAELNPDGIEEVYYKVDVLVPDAPRREAFLAMGLPVANGSIAWGTSPVPDGTAARMSVEGVGDFGFQLASPRSVQAGEGREFMEVTPAGEDGAGGFAVWRSTFSWDGGSYVQGRGFIDWPADHWVVEAIGTPRAPASFHAGTWSFRGNVTLPRALPLE
ncbi:MAG TPA: hypothetical protein VNX21_03755 [Candidatus Thermoplasmatota archaeon]|nr:hypothetical protein [Candidatus Thermoplasmatota archaeon]